MDGMGDERLVPRLSLLFFSDDPGAFRERVMIAVRLKKRAESDFKFR